MLTQEERRKPWPERHECLGIEIISAHGIIPKSKGKPDTFVKMFVPSLVQNTIVKKTKVVKKTFDPEWNEYDTVWMDGQDILRIEVWEKRAIGETFLGGISLLKSELPSGTPSADKYLSLPVTLPLYLSKDSRKTSQLKSPTFTISAPLPRPASPSQDHLVRFSADSDPPIMNDSALSTKEMAKSMIDIRPSNTKADQSVPTKAKGSITIRINYESRHQEWLLLAPLRGKVFTWGAIRCLSPDKVILEPQVVEGLDSVAGNAKIIKLAMTCGHFSVLLDNGNYIEFGINLSKIRAGECDCFDKPVLGVPSHVKGKVVDIISGMTHYLIITELGKIYALGSNSHGELGNGTADDSICFIPKRVHGLAKEFVVGATAGRDHSMCWTRDGKLFSWGDSCLLRMWTPETDWIDGPFDNLAHSLEDEADRENRNIAPIPKRVQGLDGVKIIKAYTNLTISAALSDAGDLYTWGDHHCAGYDTRNLNIQFPTRIEVLKGMVADAAVGPSFVVALDINGQLWSWGCMYQKNQAPEAAFPLGRGGQRSFEPKIIPGLPKIRAIACSGMTLYAVDVDGQLWCWGDSPFGECFATGVSYGTPIWQPFFQDVKIELLTQGSSHAFAVLTSYD